MRPRCRCEDNIRMELTEIGIDTRNWLDSAENSPFECDIEPPGFISHGVIY